jgi:hypothetical protein
MTRMRYQRLALSMFLCLSLLGLTFTADLSAQAASPTFGSVEFQARIQPTGGRAEPVRSLPFYLLRKSVADIRREAEEAEPPMQLDEFVDGLNASTELKAWMKDHHTVALAGTDFIKKLTPDDVASIPEFLDAFMVHNGASVNAGVPAPKFKENDRLSNPEKYERERDQYLQAIQRYIVAHPESIQGIDAQLGDANPTQRWAQQQAEQQRKIDRRSQVLAQTTYLAGRAESDLDGRGILRGLAPGTYWLTTLDTPAMAGDVRLLWDVSVQVAAGQTVRIELSNLNAVEPATRLPR